MKITIKGSPKELAELARALNVTETKEKKADFLSLLTELAEDGKIKELAEAVRNADKEDSPQVEAAEQYIPFIHFKSRFEKWIRMVREANAGKENAPQVEAAEQKKKQEIFEKQMKLLSEASEFCVSDVRLTPCLYALTRAMIELNLYTGN